MCEKVDGHFWRHNFRQAIAMGLLKFLDTKEDINATQQRGQDS